LLALVEEHDPGVEARLRAGDVHAVDVINEVRRALGTGDDRLWDGILITPRVRAIVALAERETPEGAIEPANLFDAIVAEGGGLGAEILARAGGNSTMTPRVLG